MFSLHTLNGQFDTFTGKFGRIDGTAIRSATLHFLDNDSVTRTELPIFSYVDGVREEFTEFRGDRLPVEIFVDVSNVRQLRIEVVGGSLEYGYTQNASYALIGDFY